MKGLRRHVLVVVRTTKKEKGLVHPPPNPSSPLSPSPGPFACLLPVGGRFPGQELALGQLLLLLLLYLHTFMLEGGGLERKGWGAEKGEAGGG